MSKHEIVSRIRQLNHSAQEEFLMSFDRQALENYLSRLSLTQAGRGRQSVWVRTGISPAAFTRAR